jgi:protein SCO1/2
MTNSVKKMNNVELLLIILLSTIIVTTLVIYFGIIRPQQEYAKQIKIDGTFLTTPQTINDFTLTDNHGNAFTKDNLKGHWTMLFFGFTNCGMVCPTTMDALNKMYKQMEQELPSNQLPQVTFVSVDPDRDTVEKINDYINSFNSHFVGARAEIADTIALEKQFHVVAAKLEVDGQGKNQYTINHTAEILLINPNAQLQALLSYPHAPEQMVKDYKTIVSKLKG